VQYAIFGLLAFITFTPPTGSITDARQITQSKEGSAERIIDGNLPLSALVPSCMYLSLMPHK